MYLFLILFLVFPSIQSMETKDAALEKLFQIKKVSVLTAEKKAFLDYIKILESVPLYDFGKTLAAGEYKDRLTDIIYFVIQKNMIKALERIMCYFPEFINEKVLKFAEIHMNKEIKSLDAPKKIINLCEQNKEKNDEEIKASIKAFTRFNFISETLLRTIGIRSDPFTNLILYDVIKFSNLKEAMRKQYTYISTKKKEIHNIIFNTEKSYLEKCPKELKNELYECIYKQWIDEVRDNFLKKLAEIEKKRDEKRIE